jgi:transposase
MAKKKFTAELKAKVAVAALKGHKTVNELAAEFDVHPTQISCWRKQLLDGSKQIFGGKNEKCMDALVQERERLYSQIGQLAVELDWLKKKTGHLS